MLISYMYIPHDISERKLVVLDSSLEPNQQAWPKPNDVPISPSMAGFVQSHVKKSMYDSHDTKESHHMFHSTMMYLQYHPWHLIR